VPSLGEAVVSEFTCPKCGSHYFNTDLLARTGHCKGRLVLSLYGHSYTRCDFSWPRAEDARVFASPSPEVVFESGLVKAR
jgi:hypothetical protein